MSDIPATVLPLEDLRGFAVDTEAPVRSRSTTSSTLRPVGVVELRRTSQALISEEMFDKISTCPSS